MKKILILILLTISISSYSQSLQLVNVGASANDHTGDPLRTAFIKVNQVIDTVKYINSLLGYGVTKAEYGYLSGVTSSIQTQLNGKQATLVSGTNIKTINSVPILGAGNMVIGSGGTMVYPGAGIALSNGTAWTTSITDNSTNWNTAYGWGNHASAGYALNSALANYVPTSRTVNGHYLSGNVTVTAADVSLGNVTNESKATMFANPVFTGIQKVSTTDTLPLFSQVRTYVAAHGGADAGLIVRVDSIVTALKDTLSLPDYALKHPTITPKTSSYSLQVVDDGTIITMNNVGSTNLTIPLNSSQPFQNGSTITFFNIGAGTMTFVITGGVTLIYASVNLAQNKGASLTKIDTNTWILVGGLN